MAVSSEFIILGVTKVGEKALVLHTLSADWGRRSFLVTVGRNAPMALFLPLSIIDAEVSENPRSELWRLRNITSSAPLAGIRNSPSKNAMTMFMSEVLLRTVHDGESEPGLCEWCRRSVLTLDALSDDFSNYHLRFLFEFAAALGFSPSTEDLAPFAGRHLSTLGELLKADFAGFMLYPLSGAVRNELAGILLDYIGFHCESRLNIRSLKVLRELFGN